MKDPSHIPRGLSILQRLIFFHQDIFSFTQLWHFDSFYHTTENTFEESLGTVNPKNKQKSMSVLLYITLNIIN